MEKVVGILGGGQLGRMSSLAAAKLGIRTHIITPESESPASQVSFRTTVAAYEDRRSLKSFAENVDVITYEFENIPVETVRFLQKLRPVYPDDNLLEISQHRAREKSFLNDIGIPTARWSRIEKADQILDVLRKWDTGRCILKASRFGYDGKGQAVFRAGDDIYESWAKLSAKEAIAEEIIDFSCEISMIIARDKLSQTAVYGPVLNEHRDNILFRSTMPAPVPASLATKARELIQLLADAVDLVGVMALEMFVTSSGEVLANEIAPRTHNSGHWSIDACGCSQFENHIRTICGLNVGHPARHSDAVMVNLIGKDIRHTARFLEIKNACVHEYGKAEIRPGRKMGHVTMLGDQESANKEIDDPVMRTLSAR
jgi:5-(carboxyamino)imidazole ribonucleotide synthase